MVGWTRMDNFIKYSIMNFEYSMFVCWKYTLFSTGGCHGDCTLRGYADCKKFENTCISASITIVSAGVFFVANSVSFFAFHQTFRCSRSCSPNLYFAFFLFAHISRHILSAFCSPFWRRIPAETQSINTCILVNRWIEMWITMPSWYLQWRTAAKEDKRL